MHEQWFWPTAYRLLPIAYRLLPIAASPRIIDDALANSSLTS
jgi:hypothetical protein